jgi:hypothetical protein
MVIYKGIHASTSEVLVEYFSDETAANAFAQENKADYPTWTIIPLSGLSNLIFETENNEEEFDELDNSKLDDEK